MANIVKGLFLKGAFLSGYKSIDKVDIEFQKGLNIIIGKNAAGKTNFLNFLNKNLSLDYDELNNFSAHLIFQNGVQISLNSIRNIEIKDLFEKSNLNSKVESTLTISNKVIKDEKGEETNIQEKLINNNIVFDNTFLCHGIPKDYLIVDKPLTFKTEKGKISNEISSLFREYKNPYFLRSIALDILFGTLGLEEFDHDVIKELLNKVFRNIEILKDILKRYSPIEDLRFSESYNIFIEENKESYIINNLFLEFKIGGSWLPYSSLSDGTKRLFYIISEVYEYPTINIRPSSNGRYYGVSDISRIILIEEPELGIHPHQFQKLIEFLKLESEKKQIILTTHSPQVLDILSENEFDRIIIAYSKNSKEGTKLRHLNEEELTKAKAYIKEDFLSDYWLYSDLEK